MALLHSYTSYPIHALPRPIDNILEQRKPRPAPQRRSNREKKGCLLHTYIRVWLINGKVSGDTMQGKKHNEKTKQQEGSLDAKEGRRERKKEAGERKEG